VTVTIDQLAFRTILGHFATGVVVVTADVDGDLLGLAVNSFSSVSLEPPLIGFFVANTSTTWPRIREAGSFAVNVLREEQEDVCRRFAAKDADRFAGYRWGVTPSGHPVLADALVWIDCTVESLAPAGDHEMVLGRVRALSEPNDGRPLLFYRGGYTGLRGEIAPS
jgi:3-hydroxy-9,10-secoandrosta-1,3,5(10)-triene-9,17-dione monooxygenase reductase component